MGDSPASRARQVIDDMSKKSARRTMGDTAESILKDLLRMMTEYHGRLTETCRDLHGYKRLLLKSEDSFMAMASKLSVPTRDELDAESAWRALESATIGVALSTIEPWLGHYGPHLLDFQRRVRELKAQPPKAQPPKAQPPKAQPPKAQPPKAQPPKKPSKRARRKGDGAHPRARS